MKKREALEHLLKDGYEALAVIAKILEEENKDGDNNIYIIKVNEHPMVDPQSWRVAEFNLDEVQDAVAFVRASGFPARIDTVTEEKLARLNQELLENLKGEIEYRAQEALDILGSYTNYSLDDMMRFIMKNIVTLGMDLEGQNHGPTFIEDYFELEEDCDCEDDGYNYDNYEDDDYDEDYCCGYYDC